MNDHRGHRSVPVAAPILLLAGLCALLFAACGTTTPSATPTLAAVPTAAPATAAAITAEPPTAAPTAAPPTAAPSAAAGTPACTAADLKATHGLVEGAAGSRLTEVLIVTAVSCSIDATPTLGLRDASGGAIVGGVATGAGRIDLSPELSYSTSVRFANWCNPEPEFPLELTIRLGGGEELPVGGGSFPDEESGMPPCNGEVVAPTLEGGAWEPGAA